MDPKTIRNNLAKLCARLDELSAVEGGPRPQAAILKPSLVREDLDPIGGVTVVIVDPNVNLGTYEEIVHRWSNFQIEAYHSFELAPENGITIWTPGVDWNDQLEKLSKESVRNGKTDFSNIRGAWNRIRELRHPNGKAERTVFFGTLINRSGFMLEVYEGRIPRDLTILPGVWRAIKDHFDFYRSAMTRKKTEHLIYSTIAIMKWAYSSDIKHITGIKATLSLWPGAERLPGIPAEELAKVQEWAEKVVGQIFAEAGCENLPVEWISKEEFYATQRLANVL